MIGTVRNFLNNEFVSFLIFSSCGYRIFLVNAVVKFNHVKTRVDIKIQLFQHLITLGNSCVSQPVEVEGLLIEGT